jgi:hypothetical protein
VPIQRQEELEAVLEEDLDGRVEERDGEEPPVGAVLDGEDVVGHFEGADVDEGELFGFVLRVSAGRLLSYTHARSQAQAVEISHA